MKQSMMSPIRAGLSCLVFFASLFILNGCFNSTGDPTPGKNKKPEPAAMFTYSVGNNGTVEFTNLSTNATTYQWDFGDQTGTFEDMNPVHQYKSNGSFSVILVATDDDGAYNSTTKTITVNNVPGAVAYKNTAQTDATITINGQTQVASPGETVTFFGTPDTPATGTAITYGATSDGTPIGLQLSFTIDDTFDTSGSVTELQVGESFFFLRVKNSWAYPITTVYVNYGLSSQTVDYITIPNNGVTYDLGYYENVSNSNVRFENGSQVWFANIYPGYEVNSVGTVEVE